MPPELDPDLLNDFLTESRELTEQLDGDLVRLEQCREGEASQELLDSAFRALHTIKGAAGFLGLSNVTTFAHVAEDALNKLRRREAPVTQQAMDSLLQSVDVVRSMIQSIGDGQEPPPCPEELLASLRRIAGGAPGAVKAPSSAAAAAQTHHHPAAPDAGGVTTRPLKLPPQKQDLLGFMVADLSDSTQQMSKAIEQLANPATRSDGVLGLSEVAESLLKTLDFFELDDLTRLVASVSRGASGLERTPDETVGELALRLDAVRHLLDEQSAALENQLVVCRPVDDLIRQIDSLFQGSPVEVPQSIGVSPEPVNAGALQANPRQASADSADDAPSGESSSSQDEPVHERRSTDRRAADRSANAGAEQTVRVEVSRLETLLNLVGQMVLTKNRLTALSRQVRELDIPVELRGDLNAATGDLDRLTSELQMGVMRTRMQPLSKLFDRYPRVIRDLSRIAGKEINLEIVGKETEVDKSVLELLSDPLVHILRNSADHGIEPPDQRRASGKSPTGTVRLTAEHQGSHVRIAIEDDGKGLDRTAIGNKALERGLVTPDQLAAMPDEEVFRFIFAAGLSTAAQVTDLSGRGVGMDVVRANVIKMNGVINVSSTLGKGTTIEILIPLTVAIMPAMVVGIGSHLYCIPLQSIVEIVQPDSQQLHTIRGEPVMRLRNSVLPLIDMRTRLGETGGQARFAVVTRVGGQQAGLMVDRLVGQNEIVIKPLDDHFTQGGPFSGATIREDGCVSLILDMAKLLHSVDERSAAA